MALSSQHNKLHTQLRAAWHTRLTVLVYDILGVMLLPLGWEAGQAAWYWLGLALLVVNTWMVRQLRGRIEWLNRQLADLAPVL